MRDAMSLIKAYGDPWVYTYLTKNNVSNGYVVWRDDQPAGGLKGWSNPGSIVINLNTKALWGNASDKYLNNLLQNKNPVGGPVGPVKPNSPASYAKSNYAKILLNLVDALYHEAAHSENGEYVNANEKRAYDMEVGFLNAMLTKGQFSKHELNIINGLMDDAIRDALEKHKLKIHDPRCPWRVWGT